MKLYKNIHNEWLLTVQCRAYVYYNRYNSQGQVSYSAWAKVRRWLAPKSDSVYCAPLEYLQVHLIGRIKTPRWEQGMPWGTSPHIKSHPPPWTESDSLFFLLIVGDELYKTLPPQLREACEKERHANCH